MFEVYKKGQGITARWVAAGGLGALAVFGCYELYDAITGWTGATLNLGVAQVSVALLVSVAAFFVAAVGIGLLINYRRFVDYLILSEIELRKVSWPTRTELKRQTGVVIITLLFFSGVLLIADLVFAFGSTKLYGL